MYEEDVDDATLRLLVKYVLRQFTHVSNLGTRHFLDAMFLWFVSFCVKILHTRADHESICKPQSLLKRAMPQLVKYGGKSHPVVSTESSGYEGPTTDIEPPALGTPAKKIDARAGEQGREQHQRSAGV
ncbi:uncharacterized protein BXIN_1202 [Babesia sp. Xinjiang]|uniref:uncharacterized protein n=1 Tax=Babesia sp. Xinjiang TaxID=462227 RepID=UPI000A21BF0D|nr:uncharacterized protein BXIN_1202 [Babesia sp. Xinjiang]ORM40121.1 hypothetical protein BXIN_1202 [Babesia sp. Xinjiang]